MQTQVPTPRPRGAYKLKDGIEWEPIEDHFDTKVTKFNQMKLVGREGSVHNGYTYINLEKRGFGVTRMRCQHRTYKGESKCKGAIKIHPNNLLFSEMKWHSCQLKSALVVHSREEMKAPAGQSQSKVNDEAPSLTRSLQQPDVNVPLR